MREVFAAKVAPMLQRRETSETNPRNLIAGRAQDCWLKFGMLHIGVYSALVPVGSRVTERTHGPF